jgi:hypothetical protein
MSSPPPSVIIVRSTTLGQDGGESVWQTRQHGLFSRERGEQREGQRSVVGEAWSTSKHYGGLEAISEADREGGSKGGV